MIKPLMPDYGPVFESKIVLKVFSRSRLIEREAIWTKSMLIRPKLSSAFGQHLLHLVQSSYHRLESNSCRQDTSLRVCPPLSTEPRPEVFQVLHQPLSLDKKLHRTSFSDGPSNFETWQSWHERNQEQEEVKMIKILLTTRQDNVSKRIH